MTSSVRATLTAHSCFTACVWSLARGIAGCYPAIYSAETRPVGMSLLAISAMGITPFLPHRISYEEMARYADSTTVEQPC